ncbi:MAG: hypothetical protein EXS05_22285 [Planctomycetaceae bacterium]|nr:hypothetical protein [Planctomycetaceae bacterium]
MVRVTRFSFEDGMNVNEPIPRETFEDDLDDLITDEQRPLKSPGTPRRQKKRNDPADRRTDRRHAAGGEWTKPTQPEDRGNEDEKRK